MFVRKTHAFYIDEIDGRAQTRMENPRCSQKRHLAKQLLLLSNIKAENGKEQSNVSILCSSRMRIFDPQTI